MGLRHAIRLATLLCGLAGIGLPGWVGAADGAAPGSNAERAKVALQRDQVCTRCHDESEAAPILTIYQTRHGARGDARAPSCQSCHGESAGHVRGGSNGGSRPSPDVVFKKGAFALSDDRERSGQCLSCHKDGRRNNWDHGAHSNNNVACNDCHVVHRPADRLLTKKTQPEVCFTCHKDQRVDVRKISHHPIPEGKVACSDCHNPHGSVAPKMLVKNTVTETCTSCHAEKRGPFLWEHQPVAEDCSNCHSPHGSNIGPLLKSRPPFLCQECHDGPHNSKTPYAKSVGGLQAGLAAAAAPTNPNSNAVGRACMNCHAMVHGTNSPAGAYLHR